MYEYDYYENDAYDYDQDTYYSDQQETTYGAPHRHYDTKYSMEDYDNGYSDENFFDEL